MKKIFLIFLTLFVTINLYSQSGNNQILKNNPLDVINKVITYGIENRNTFNGSSKSVVIMGDSYFSFRKFSNKFPSIIVTYSVLGRSATEGGMLKNIKFVNNGNFNTKIITADWINFDKNAGSGTFELSILDDKYPNKLYLGITGYEWSHYINIELKENDFQDLINLLTYSGKPRNFIKEKQDKIDAELLAKKLELRNKFIQDSLNKERVKKDLIAKKAIELELVIAKRIKDSIDLVKDDSIRMGLEISSIYHDGIVIKIEGIENDKHGLLLSNNEEILTVQGLTDMASNFKNGWRLPSVTEMKFIVKLIKSDKKFNVLFTNTKNKGSTYGWGEMDWWFAMPDNGIFPDNLWWIFKSSIGRDQQIVDKYTTAASLNRQYFRLRLVREF